MQSLCSLESFPKKGLIVIHLSLRCLEVCFNSKVNQISET
jgi:hypothetical protein